MYFLCVHTVEEINFGFSDDEDETSDANLADDASSVQIEPMDEDDDVEIPLTKVDVSTLDANRVKAGYF